MKKLLTILFILLGLILISCDTTETNPEDNSDIPGDPSGITVPTPNKNNVIPTATFTNSGARVKINLQGLIDPTTNQPITLSYNSSNPQNSNIFVTEDGVVQGLKVTKVSSGNVLQADVVFVVDNSGSMGQESDSIAASIIEFANFLQASGLDAKFAVVGQSGSVNGGINFTNAAGISTYLERTTGTSRTYGFSGPDSANLVMRANNFGFATAENGVIAAIYADSVYSWRSGAQRVIINFTDEPTQSDGAMWNNAMGCNLLGGKATVHTVFSNDSTAYNWDFDDERPWKLSECTGGTILFIPSNAAGLNLQNLPVAGALSNSYLVEFLGTSGGQRTVIITIFTSTADGSRSYTVSY